MTVQMLTIRHDPDRILIFIDFLFLNVFSSSRYLKIRESVCHRINIAKHIIQDCMQLVDDHILTTPFCQSPIFFGRVGRNNCLLPYFKPCKFSHWLTTTHLQIIFNFFFLFLIGIFDYIIFNDF